MKSDILACIPCAYLYGGCHKYPLETLACLHRLLFLGRTKWIYLASRSLPLPPTCATKADETGNLCGCTPLPEATVAPWISDCDWGLVNNPWLFRVNGHRWRTQALVLFVISRQQQWNATGVWQKLSHLVRFFLRWTYMWSWRARQTILVSLQCQDFVITQSQYDTQGTSLAFGQDLWWNLSLPAGTFLVYAVCHYPTFHCNDRNQQADKGRSITFIIISMCQENGHQHWQWLPAVGVPDFVLLSRLKPRARTSSLSCPTSFVDRNHHRQERYQALEKMNARNTARGNQAIYNPSV